MSCIFYLAAATHSHVRGTPIHLELDATCQTRCNMSDTTATGTHQQSEGFSLVEQGRLQAHRRCHLLSPLPTPNTTCTYGVCHKECVTIQWWQQQDVHANASTSSYTTRRRKGSRSHLGGVPFDDCGMCLPCFLHLCRQYQSQDVPLTKCACQGVSAYYPHSLSAADATGVSTDRQERPWVQGHLARSLVS